MLNGLAGYSVLGEIRENTSIIFYGVEEDQLLSLIAEKGEEKNPAINWKSFLEKNLRELNLESTPDILKERVNVFVNATVQPICPRGLECISLLGDITRTCSNDSLISMSTGVSFGEPLEGRVFPCIEPYRGRLGEMIEKSLRGVMSSETLIVVGKSDVLEPISHLPWASKIVGGVRILEVNLEPTCLTRYADRFVPADPWATLELMFKETKE